MKTKIFTILITALVAVGCSKAPDPVKLDGGSSTTINQSLITEKITEIQKDPFLQNTKWTYNMYFNKVGDEYLKNDEIVKGFYLAHNADKIIIIGDEKTASAYKNYFLSNQVKANITIHPVDYIDGSKNRVNVLFFSKNLKETK